MHRQQPVTTAPRRLMIVALVMLVFTGLAIWQTVHCADHSPAPASAVAMATGHAVDHADDTHRHDQQARVATWQSSTSVAEDCHVRAHSSVASTATTVVVSPPERASGRLRPDCVAAPTLRRPAGSAGITLTAIGVSRT